MKPNKVEQSIIIKENKSKVENFKKNTTYIIVKTEENAFTNIDIKEIIQEAEAEEDEGACTFDDQNNNTNEIYDTGTCHSDDEIKKIILCILCL